MKPIKDIFDKFCQERHAEDKGRNFNFLQEIYADTEFFDTSNNQTLGLLKDFKKDVEYSARFTFTYLPFQNVFVRVSDSVYVFLREYAPYTITGTCYVTDGIGFTLNVPFTIRNIPLTEFDIIITSNFHDPKFEQLLGNISFNTLCHDLIYGKQEIGYPNTYFCTGNVDVIISRIFEIVCGVLVTFDSLNTCSVAVDKPTNPNLCEYYRRKHAPTIKIPTRPIYYVLGSKEEQEYSEEVIRKKYPHIKPIGKLEYSHAFHVRGHWRRINEGTLGKDRHGNYCMKGFTWVTEYVKGEGELVKRLRVIK